MYGSHGEVAMPDNFPFEALNPILQEDDAVLRFDCPCRGRDGCGQKVRLRIKGAMWTMEGQLPRVTIRPSIMDGAEEGRKHFHILVTAGEVHHT